jgi:hypothetical protein
VIPRSEAGVILTYTGKRFKPLDPNPADIDPLDIAHATANQCRYTGHTKYFYSVAYHSCIIHDYLEKNGESREVCLWGLLHDASEAYLLDLAAPLKHHPDGFGEKFLEREEAIEHAVAARFGLSMPIPPEVKDIDIQLRTTEMQQLLPEHDLSQKWGDPLPIKILRYTPFESEMLMLWRMQKYGLVRRDAHGEFVSN